MVLAMEQIIEDLITRIALLRFSSPVTHVYNPLVYARDGYMLYYQKYGVMPKEILLVGMNPGPWGMAQTGVPFGDVNMVRHWLGITARVGAPEHPHPKRPIQGYDCSRSEVSGKRLWGWAMERFVTPERFFRRFWVANYCPLVFMEESGRNRTPDKLRKDEKIPLFEACDEALCRIVEMLRPRHVIGVGNFAYQRVQSALANHDIIMGRISHPSPANPLANKGWSRLIEQEFAAQGVSL